MSSFRRAMLLASANGIGKKVEKYVNDYATAIGTTSYNTALTAMFTSLVTEGLDKKLYMLCPMLGDTTAKQKVNALKPGTHDLFLGANASVSDGVLNFANTVGVGDKTSSIEFLTTETNYSVLVVYDRVRPSNGISQSIILAFGRPNKTTDTGNVVTVGTSFGSAICHRLHNMDSTANKDFTDDFTGIKCACFVQTGKTQVGTFNGESYTTTYVDDNPSYVTTPNTFFGFHWSAAKSTAEGETIERNTNIWEGHSYFYAIGALTAAENATFKTIVATFLNAVKEIVIT